MRRSRKRFPRAEALEQRLLFAVRTWDAGATLSNKWSNPKNWDGDVVPVAGDTLIFPDVAGDKFSGDTNDLPAGTAFHSITFTGSNYTIGGNRITITGGLIVSKAPDDTTLNSLDMDITFTTDTVLVAGGKGLGLGGALSGNVVLTVDTSGGGTVSFAGGSNNTYTGATLLQGIGELHVDKDSGAIAIPGPLTIDDGTRVEYFLHDNQIADSAPVTLKGSGKLDLNGQSDTIGSLTMSDGFVTTNTGTLKVHGDVTAPGGFTNNFINGNLSLNGIGAFIVTGILNVNAVLSDGGLKKLGIGRLRLTATNTYTNITSVLDGTLDLASPTGNAILGTLVINGTAGNPATVEESDDNQIADTASVKVENGVLKFFSGHSDAIGPLTLTGGKVDALFGKLVLNGDVTVNPSSVIATIFGNVALSRGQAVPNLTLPTVVRTFTVGDGAANPDLRIGGAIVNAGAAFGTAGITKLGAGTLQFTGNEANSYTGPTTVSEGLVQLGMSAGVNAFAGSLSIGTNTTGAAATVRWNFSDQLPDGTTVTVNRTGLLDLNDKSETVGALKLESGAVKTGTGVLTVPGDITSIAIAPPGSTSLIGAQSATITGNLRLNGSAPTFNIADGLPANDLIITGTIATSADPAFSKIGVGTLVIAGNSTYAGATKASAGTLRMNDATLTGTVNIAAGATFGGTSIVGKIFADGGTLDPGSAPHAAGILTSTGDVTLTSSKLNIDLNGTAAGSFDHLVVGGALDLTRATPVVTVGFVSAVGDTFLIINHTGGGASGPFLGLAEGATFTATNGQLFQISYVGGDGNDVTLTHKDTAPAFKDRKITANVREGSLATLTGTITEPDPKDTFFLDVNWGDGSKQTYTFKPGTSRDVRVTHRYADDNSNGKSDIDHVALVWRDNHGLSNSANLDVKILNVAPKLTNLAVTRNKGETKLTGRITDPGTHDSFTLKIDWGDGTTTIEHLKPGTTTFSAQHTYAKKHAKQIHVQITDDDGGSFATDIALSTSKQHGHGHHGEKHKDKHKHK